MKQNKKACFYMKNTMILIWVMILSALPFYSVAEYSFSDDADAVEEADLWQLTIRSW